MMHLRMARLTFCLLTSKYASLPYCCRVVFKIDASTLSVTFLTYPKTFPPSAVPEIDCGRACRLVCS